MAYSDATGWRMFPARMDGWSQREAVAGRDHGDLFQVPIWLTFNTGLDCGEHERGLVQAA